MMERYNIIWSPKARDDLQNIYLYIKDYFKEKNIAYKIIIKILNSVQNLIYFPERNIKIKFDSKDKKDIRKFVIKQYVIIYEINNNMRQINIYIFFMIVKIILKIYKSF